MDEPIPQVLQDKFPRAVPVVEHLAKKLEEFLLLFV
jgi:hypothetical protein